MASLTSGSWTITGANASIPNGIDVEYGKRKKRIDLKLTMASGEWPAAGVNMPGAGSVGFIRNLDYYLLAPKLATASGYRIGFALTTGNKIRVINTPGKQVLVSGSGNAPGLFATTITVASQIFYVQAVGW